MPITMPRVLVELTNLNIVILENRLLLKVALGKRKDAKQK
jgi:hypothetical protein